MQFKTLLTYTYSIASQTIIILYYDNKKNNTYPA
jgi:hypothetical protein